MNKVREVREGIGMSQTELARRTHIHPSNLSAVERGRLVAWPKAKRSLARVLKKTIAELFPNGEERVS
jgi:DNA-binding XRE family transcriptional regulator